MSRRLLPLGYGLAAVVLLIIALGWFVLQVQLTLAGFLNSESLWSKAQKQVIINLVAYADTGDPAALASFHHYQNVLSSDRWGRDAIASGRFTDREIDEVFRRGSMMPVSQPGMILVLRYFSGAPHMKDALDAWRSTDASLDELEHIADELQQSYRAGHVATAEIARQRARILAVDAVITPQTQVFSVQVVNGALWFGRLLMTAVLSAFVLAALLWLGMARRVIENIQSGENRYRLLFDNAADAVLMIDGQSGKILDANATAAKWTGQEVEQLVGLDYTQLLDSDQAVASAQPSAMTLRMADGSSRPVETKSSLSQWGTQQVRQVFISDISERVSMEQERRIAAEALASVAEGVIIADATRAVVSVNAAHTRITGLTAAEMIGRRFDEMRHAYNGQPLPDSVWRTIADRGYWQGEVWSRRNDGTSYPEMLSISAIRDTHGHVQHYVAVFTNNTAAKANQRRLEHLATHDPLTGLVNRSEFERRCAQAITQAAHERTAVAVLFVDLDTFKIVNDSYTHAIGDRLLVKVAERIRMELSGEDVAGRIGGDEFTVLVGRLTAREDAYALAQRLLGSLAEPFVIGEYEVLLSASIGIAGYPLDGTDAVTLISNADAAMYAAKTEERNAFRFYTPLMHADARKRMNMAVQLRRALVNEEFSLVFQPSIELATGHIVAVETLVRWNHPERGELLPADFIHVAESLGLLRKIDAWVLRAACQQIRRWEDEGVPPVRVAVNVSAGWFSQSNFIDEFRLTLRSHRIEGERVMIEITESAMLKLGEDTERTMRALHAMGISVAIDDFGTGYSSLAYLKLPAVAVLKIDRSFVDGIPDHGNDVAITEAMLAIAQSMGLRCIAEGIENEAQHAFLLKAGCQEGQGFLYSRPVPAAEIEKLLNPRPTQRTPQLRLVPPER